MSKPRAKVVCIKEGKWTGKRDACKDPVKGEIYTIEVIEEGDDGAYYVLAECDQTAAYWSKWFRPLDYDFVDNVLKQIQPQTVEV